MVNYGKPIVVDDYMEEFLSEGEGAARSAAKRLTRDIENWLIRSTINAPDWLVPLQLVQSKFLMVMSRDTLYSARMARDLLWPDEKSINLKDFVDISQTYVPKLLPLVTTLHRKQIGRPPLQS